MLIQDNMPKKTITKEKKPDIAKVVSVMGTKKFNEEVRKGMLSGAPAGEAADLVVRMKLKGMI